MRNGGSPIPTKFHALDGVLLAVMPADGFFGTTPLGASVFISNSHYPMAWDLRRPIISFSPSTSCFDPYHFLAKIVYLVSNKLVKASDTLEVFGTITDRIPRKLIFKIFKSNFPSIQAFWWELLTAAGSHGVKRVVTLLIAVARQAHPEWIEANKDYLLFLSPLTNDLSLVQMVLDQGANPVRYFAVHDDASQTVLGVAAHSGAIECAKLLIGSCDINADRDTETMYGGQSIFSAFVSKLGLKLETSMRHEEHSTSKYLLSDYFTILTLLLNAGGNVDLIFSSPFDRVYSSHHVEMDALYHEMISHRISLLDICFYRFRPIFDLMIHYSCAWRNSLTRSGVCIAILQSKEALDSYLHSRSDASDLSAAQYLDLLLAEQFQFLSVEGIHCTVVRALIEYGVSSRCLTILCQKDLTLMRRVVSLSSISGFSEDLLFLFEYLVQHGAVLDDITLYSSICETGTKVLEVVTKKWVNLKHFGPKALLLAATNRNYKAMDLILRLGVDINDIVENQYGSMTIAAHLVVDGWYSQESTGLWHMLQYLTDNGAKLRLHREDSTCFELLKAALRECDIFECVWGLFNFLLVHEDGLRDNSASQWLELLDLSINSGRRDRWGNNTSRFIAAFFERCDQPLMQQILSDMIGPGCDQEFIEKLINSGQSIHEYSSSGLTPIQAAARASDCDLMSFLLTRGADINAPGQGEDGGTALQLMCGNLLGTRSATRPVEVVKFMIKNGAHINAPPHRPRGATALQLICACWPQTNEEACALGEIFDLLLKLGADANAAPGIYEKTSLQHCAQNGDLGKVATLIQHGADPNGFPSIGKVVEMDLPGSLREPLERMEKTIMTAESALDSAVWGGRLDVCQYLLNVGALSARPGKTGFKGAIDIAMQTENWALAETIRRHESKIAQQQRLNPEMLLAHRRCVEQHALAADQQGARLLQQKMLDGGREIKALYCLWREEDRSRLEKEASYTAPRVPNILDCYARFQVDGLWT